MSDPVVNSVEVAGGVVMLSIDPEAPNPVEVTLYGSNLENVTEVQLDSGEDYSWVVGNVSASTDTVVVTAYAFGSVEGVSDLVAIVEDAGGPPAYTVADFVLPLID